MPFKVPNKYRIKEGRLGSNDQAGHNGAFIIPFDSCYLTVIASDRCNWEHVSVSLKNQTPNWKEMCFIKDLFWDKEDCVIQYHPPQSECINNHSYVLHLWRPIKEKIPVPDSILVGIKELNL